MAAEVIGHLTTDDAGRGFLSAEVYASLGELAQSNNQAVRAAAAVSLAKTLAVSRKQMNQQQGSTSVNLASQLSADDAAQAELASKGVSFDKGSGSSHASASASAGDAPPTNEAVMELYNGVADALKLSWEGMSSISGGKTKGTTGAPSSGAGSASKQALGVFQASSAPTDWTVLSAASRSIEALACLSGRVPVKSRLSADTTTLHAVVSLAREAAAAQVHAIRALRSGTDSLSQVDGSDSRLAKHATLE